MKCPNCGLEDNPDDHYAYFEYSWHNGKFLLNCIECRHRWRPTKPEEIIK